MQNYDYDIVVIGSGPGGYETAIKAAQLGKKTCIIEEKNFGGTCLNIGCIPTKVLIHTADLTSEIKEASKLAIEGVEPDKISVDMSRLQKHKEKVVKRLTGGVGMLLKANKVDIVQAKASFVDSHTLSAGDKTITAENIIIATGSSVFMPPFISVDEKSNVITSDEALGLSELPGSIAIIGGGVIGIEFAYLFNKLGAKVTVLELMDHILPMVDTEISAFAKKEMEKNGVEFYLGARVEKVEDNAVWFKPEGKEESESIKADTILMAVGRIPNTEGLNAEAAGIEFEKRAIRTDSALRTNVPNIYAIGDVNGKVMLAHTASHEGMTALANICGHEEEMDYDKIPSCIYISPEISAIGLTENAAKEKYENVKVGRFPLMANGKSLIEGCEQGMVKVIVEEETGEILGVHMFGARVTEMIGEISLAMSSELTAEEVIHSIHPHPTISESIGEAFRAAWDGRAINNL